MTVPARVSCPRLIPICVALSLFYYYISYKLQVSHHMLGQKKRTAAALESRVHLSNFSSADQTDPDLISYVRETYISKPSEIGYSGEEAGPTGLLDTIWPVLGKVVKNGTRGFFVEAGAYDGVAASNTLWLEKELGWTGLLVECHPEVVPLLKEKHRKAYVSRACLSKSSHPEVAELTSVNGWHPSSSLAADSKLFPAFARRFTVFQVDTLPLYTLLAAVGVKTVDFISLDVQSVEYKVLKHFPFDLILVKVWLIEVDLLSEDDLSNLKMLMKANEYAGPMHIGASDHLYVHRTSLPD